MPIKELIEQCKTRASLYGLAQAVEAELAEREELISELKDSERIWSKQHAEVSKKFIEACEEVDTLRAQLAEIEHRTGMKCGCGQHHWVCKPCHFDPLEAQLTAAQKDTERLNWLEKWLRWRPGSRHEVWTGAAGFECVEKTSAIDDPRYLLRAAIDAAMQSEEPGDAD